MTDKRFFEEIKIGEKFATGTYQLTAENIHEFASEYDPQFIHIDEEAASEGPFGGIIASGWQTLSATMRMMTQEKPFGGNPIIGMRIDNLKFAKPVTPGQSIRVDAEVVDLKKSRTGERGYVAVRLDTKNAETGEIVATQQWTCLLPCRNQD